MLKLLYLYKGHQRLFKMPNNYHRGFLTELQKQCDVKVYGPFFDDYDASLISVPKIIKKLYKQDYPNAIFYLYMNMGGANYTDLDQITTIPKVILRVDAQGQPLNTYFEQSKFTLLVNCVTRRFLPKPVTNKIPHQMLPHSVDENFFCDYGLDRNVDVCFSGAVGKDYPLRRFLIRELIKKQNKDIKTCIMPGRSAHGDTSRLILIKEISKINARINMVFPNCTKCISGEAYPKLIAQSKMLIFCNSKYKYPLNKMFEGMACKTLVMCDEPFNAKELGFVDGKTFVKIDESNAIAKIRYYLNHPNEMKRIIANAHDLIMSKHTHQIRAKQLLNFLEGKSPVIYQ